MYVEMKSAGVGGESRRAQYVSTYHYHGIGGWLGKAKAVRGCKRMLNDIKTVCRAYKCQMHIVTVQKSPGRRKPVAS